MSQPPKLLAALVVIAALTSQAGADDRCDDHSAEASPQRETASPGLLPSTSMKEEATQRGGKTGPSTGMLATGIVLLSAGHVAALIGGSYGLALGGLDEGRDTSSASLANGLLMVPVVGPFVSAIVGPSKGWGVPWAVVDGGAQVVGLALIIAGSRYKDRKPAVERIGIAPIATSTMQGLRLSGRF